MKNNKNSKKRGGGSRGGGLTSAVRIPYHNLVSLTTSAAGTNPYQMQPTVAPGMACPRLTTISDSYGLYRHLKLKFRIVNTQTVAVLQIAAYTNKDPQTTPPANFQQICEAGPSTLLGEGSTIGQSSWVKVPSKFLRGDLPWYQTNGGSTSFDQEEVIAGVIYCLGTPTSTMTIETVGVMEFSSPFDPANTPVPLPVLTRQAKELQARIDMVTRAAIVKKLDQQQKLLALLNYKEELTVTKWPSVRL